MESNLLISGPVLREQEERLESLKSLAGHLAHDFNNFLVPVLGYVTLIEEEAGTGSPILQYTGKMASAARGTQAFIEALLRATRPQRWYSRARFPLHEMAREILEEARAEWGSAPGIEFRVQLEPAEVEGDRAMWEEALRQLLRNARFALAGGGELAVSLGSGSLDPGLAGSLGLESGCVLLTVSDTGSGMSAEVCRRACEPFFTTRSKQIAAGLGLTLVHSVVRLHQGQMWIESEPDRGTRVSLWLPPRLPAEEPAGAGLAERALQAAKRKKPKALLIGQDPVCVEVFRSELQGLELDLWVTEQPGEALYQLQRHPDLALVVVSGGEDPGLVEKIRKTAAGVGLLILSSGNKNAVPGKKGAQRLEILKKPFRLSEFRAAASRLLR